MLPATVWRKLYVSIKISLRKCFQFNEVLSAFVQYLNDFPSRLFANLADFDNK